jgi:CMP-N-acetylneuraminic acid synthetase
MYDHRIVALLPIKAHSERVAGKNFRPFAGRPLFYWMLDTLQTMPEIERIIINTDAREQLVQAGLRESSRVCVRDRPPHLCGDHVSMNLIIADDIAAVSSEAYWMTHTTNPLLSGDTIRKAHAVYSQGVREGRCDSLFTVNRFQTRFYRQDASPVNHDPANLVRTQDLEPWFEENSNLYIFNRVSFAATRARIGRRPLMFTTPRIESVDIDDAEGWCIAENLARQLRPLTGKNV